MITVTCFNRPYYKSKLEIDQTITVTGKWDQHRQTINLQELQFSPFVKNQTIEPVYSVKGSLTVKGMRKFVSLALKNYGSSIQDMLPASIRSRYKLVTREEAVRSIHLPRDHEDLKQARRRFVYEEFLLFQLNAGA